MVDALDPAVLTPKVWTELVRHIAALPFPFPF